MTKDLEHMAKEIRLKVAMIQVIESYNICRTYLDFKLKVAHNSNVHILL